MHGLQKLHSGCWLPEEGYRLVLYVHNKNLFRQVFTKKETNCTIITDKADAIGKALSSIIYHREQLEEYVRNHPEFLHSLRPIHIDNGPKIVKLMASASKEANVGPMASVAGVLADLAVEAIASLGAKVAVVEDGGEISAVSNRPVDVALLAGDHALSGLMGFRLEEFPIGVATSSGVFGHALSFGEADAVTVFSRKAGVADAVATAVCNVVKGKDYRKAVGYGINKALSIKGVDGVFIIYRGITGIAGKVPRIIKIAKEGDQTGLQD
jgi:ApbE superfamily uncharacterized protein (UPF0280 family)